MLDRATASHDQVDADTEEGHCSRDPELTQRQSLSYRMKSQVELMQAAQRSVAGPQLAYVRATVA
jgi:hypothetical protein